MIYLLSYDLNQSGQNYPKIIEGIKKVDPNAKKCQKSLWVLSSKLTAPQIRDYLKAFHDTNDSVIVAHITSNTAWYNILPEAHGWMQKSTYALS